MSKIGNVKSSLICLSLRLFICLFIYLGIALTVEREVDVIQT